MVFKRHDEDEYSFERFSLVELLLSPYYVIRQFVGDLLKGDDLIRTEQSFINRFLGILFLPLRLFWGFLAFVVSTWSTSRDGYAFIKSLPVLAVLGTFGVALLLADLISTEGKRISRNRGYIRYHASRDAPQYCEMFARKLIAIKPTDENIYQLGLAYHRNKETEKALDVMRSLTTENEVGFSLAHSWMAQHFSLQQDQSLGSEERESLIDLHLSKAIQADPENQMAHYSMGLFHIETSRKFPKDSQEYRNSRFKAVEEFTKVVNAKVDGMTRFQLIAIPKLIELKIELTDDKKELKKQLSQEIIRLQPLADAYPDELDIRIAMVRCATLMEDYQRAKTIVRDGYQLASNDEARRRIAGLSSMVYLERANKFDDMTNFYQFKGRLLTLCEAVKANPTEKIVYLNLLEFVGKDPTTEGVINEEWLNQSIAGSRVPDVVHCLLGLKEISSGNVLTGENHWRIADQQFPNAKIVINNMLDVAATDRPEQFDNLLDMISLGIEMFQDQPLFYRTRGIYLTSLGRFEEAIPDLVFATEKLPNVLDTYQHLITCYEKTNQPELAEEQRQLLQVKLSELNDDQRKRMEQVIGRIK